MSAPVLERPTPAPSAPASSPPPASRRQPGGGAIVAVAAVLLTASLSLGRVYVGFDYFWPVLGAVIAALAVGWATRRLNLGPWSSLAASAACWAWYVALAFLPASLVAGVLPTPQTWMEGVELWARGWELVLVRPAPTFAEPGLLLLTVTGVWAVTFVVDTLVFLLRAPLAAIVVAIVLWVVPLTLSPGADEHWMWVAPFLAAVAALLLTVAASDVGRFGKVVAPPGGGNLQSKPGTVLPVALTLGAIVLGSMAADRLPDLGDRPWLPLRGMGSTAVASNPIVGMRQRLVSQSTSTVFTVRTTRPVYLRTTALDVYSEEEEWTNDGISARPVGETVPIDVAVPYYEQVPVEIEVVNLPEAVLVPMPYRAAAVFGSIASSLQYDRSLSTFTLDTGLTLQPGDRYAAIADIPAPTPEQLDASRNGGEDPRLTALPDSVPPELGELARQIVREAGATTRYRQALAIQDELRTWTYSLDVPSGHSRSAMAAFLESRTGYCEQFAGTMAAMLRTLGIPTRVAVGFTPGVPAQAASPGEATTYVVSQANAHAWVEVLFPEIGWLAFEPTPRSDGNVLVPSATNLAPELTAREMAPTEPLLPRSDDVALQEEGGVAPQAPPPAASAAAPTAGVARALGPQLPSAATLLGVVAVLLTGGLVAGGVRRRSAAVASRAPVERVLHASRRVRLLGHALGIPAAASATDSEYLHHLVDARGVSGGHAAAALAGCVERARWSRHVPAQDASTAETAAAELERLLLQPLPQTKRVVVQARRRVQPAIGMLQGAGPRLVNGRLRLAGLPLGRGDRAGSG